MDAQKKQERIVEYQIYFETVKYLATVSLASTGFISATYSNVFQEFLFQGLLVASILGFIGCIVFAYLPMLVVTTKNDGEKRRVVA